MNQKEIENASFDDLLEEYLNQENIGNRFEGQRGLERLNRICSIIGYRKQICSIIGYREQSFRYGSPVELFLQDNPGVFTAILEWIAKEAGEDWTNAMADQIEPENNYEYRAEHFGHADVPNDFAKQMKADGFEQIFLDRQGHSCYVTYRRLLNEDE